MSFAFDPHAWQTCFFFCFCFLIFGSARATFLVAGIAKDALDPGCQPDMHLNRELRKIKERHHNISGACVDLTLISRAATDDLGRRMTFTSPH